MTTSRTVNLRIEHSSALCSLTPLLKPARLDPRRYWHGTAVDARIPNIVIVDDNRSQLRLHELATRGLPINVYPFGSPTQALAFLAEHDAALILLDIIMQEIDGLSVLRRLRTMDRHKDTAVLFITGKDYQEDRTIAKELGALDYLVKPLSPLELRRLVKTHALSGVDAAD